MYSHVTGGPGGGSETVGWPSSVLAGGTSSWSAVAIWRSTPSLSPMHPPGKAGGAGGRLWQLQEAQQRPLGHASAVHWPLRYNCAQVASVRDERSSPAIAGVISTRASRNAASSSTHGGSIGGDGGDGERTVPGGGDGGGLGAGGLGGEAGLSHGRVHLHVAQQAVGKMSHTVLHTSFDLM
eukprot:scaffold72449_cov30-Tisochrysis_lutea.AAC.9